MRIVRLITSGVVDRIVASKRLESAMSKPENKLESGRPVIVPEYFTGEGSFEDWIDGDHRPVREYCRDKPLERWAEVDVVKSSPYREGFDDVQEVLSRRVVLLRMR